jgi:hypothetical protein
LIRPFAFLKIPVIYSLKASLNRHLLEGLCTIGVARFSGWLFHYVFRFAPHFSWFQRSLRNWILARLT